MTQRQHEILAAIVKTYASTAEPVGSLAMSRQFGLSPATIRAEMASLENAGYIRQPHTSAGRIPTDKGYRSYVNSLHEVYTSERLEDVIARRVKQAGGAERAIKNAVDSLSETTHNAGVATIGDGLYTTGLASLFAQPEFNVPRQVFEVARLLDNLDQWLQEAAPTEPVSVWIGQENPVGKSSGCSLIMARFNSPYSDRSYIGVVGPTRQNYDQVLGLVDYTRKLLAEVL